MGYRGFLYTLEGSISVGTKQVTKGQLAFLEEEGEELRLTGGAAGARVILYAGQPQREPCIQFGGVFVAGDMAGIQNLNLEFRKGGFRRLSELGGVV